MRHRTHGLRGEALRKTNVTAILLWIVMAFDLHAQPSSGTFEWLNPQFSQETFYNLHRISIDSIEIIGERNALRSTDDGRTWQFLALDPAIIGILQTAKWADTKRAWALDARYSGDSTLEHTIDGGYSWKKSKAPFVVSSFASTGNDSCWVLSSTGEFSCTLDGGLTWSKKSSLFWPSPSGMWVLGEGNLYVPIPSPNTKPNGGKVVGGLLRSRDAGLSWDTLDFTYVTTNGWQKAVPSNFWPIGNGSFRVFTDSLAYSTTDFGTHWVPGQYSIPQLKAKDPDVKSTLRFVLPFNHDTAFGTGFFDEMYKTTDGGNNWAVLDTGTAPVYIWAGPSRSLWISPGIIGIDVSSLVRFIRYGRAGQLFTSEDTGAHWEARNRGFTYSTLTSISFASASTGMIGSSQGDSWLTTDGGNSWVNRQIPNVIDYISTISLVDGTHAWAALGRDSGIYHTSDAGIHWVYSAIEGLRSDTSTGKPKIERIQMVTADIGFGCGAQGNIVKTIDGGVSWSILPYPFSNPSNLHALSFVSPSWGWIVGDSGKVMHTTDGGVSWKPQETHDVPPFPSANNYIAQLHSVSFSDSLNGIVAGNYGRVFVTSDGGASWSKGLQGEDATNWAFGGFYDLIQMPNRSVWAGARIGSGAGGFSWSSDAGASWTPCKQLFGPLGGISFPDNKTGYFCGDNGAIVKWTAGSSSVAGSGSVSNQYLFIAAFPMPASNDISCTLYGLYSVSDRASVIFAIYDMLGRKVLDLSEQAESHSNGAYSQFTFNARSLPSGTYLMTLTTSNGSTSSPLVIIR